MKHCLSLQDFSADEVTHLVRLALKIKKNPQQYNQLLRGRWLLMLFQKSSTRTRLSFEMGIKQLGGNSVVMDWDASNFAISPIRYEARYVSQHAHLIMARLKTHTDLLKLAEYSRVPVINGCDDTFHPCQALADLTTVFETAGTFQHQTLCYVGIHNNVANSLALGCARAGVHLILVTPEANKPAHKTEMLDKLEADGHLSRTLDVKQAIAKAGFVYTDTWVDMEFFKDPAYQDEKERRLKTMLPYQLNRENMGDSDAYILHDMPIHPGYEITEDLVESPRSLIYRQAENRLYAQQALALHLLDTPLP
ncbi:MAG: ornithine carbamoyltransferase [Deltaproteobacteria bacterium]|nr:ornithine carbamoyltransferase [Deltaproteobacteria bacterium]